MIDLDQLAKQKSQALNEDFNEWQRRLRLYMEEGALAKLTDGELERFIAALDSVNQLDRIHQSLLSSEGSIDRLFSISDESPYDLPDWLKAYDSFLKWLENQKSSASANVMLGYLSCCEEYSKGKPQLETLDEILLSMLDEHGFDGKIPQRLTLVKDK